MNLAGLSANEDLNAAQKRELSDKWSLIEINCQEPHDIANMKSDTTKDRLLGKEHPTIVGFMKDKT